MQVHDPGPAHLERPGSAQRVWRLVPETDPALYPGQAGDLPHTPAMLLRYVQHLHTLLSRQGVTNLTITASSCVSVNGRPAQPLYKPATDLLQHGPSYFAFANALRPYSGVGRFLTGWQVSPTNSTFIPFSASRVDLSPASQALLSLVQRTSARYLPVRHDCTDPAARLRTLRTYSTDVLYLRTLLTYSTDVLY